MKKLLSLMLALAMLTACTITAFAAETIYGPFAISPSSKWTLAEQNGMMVATNSDYPLYIGMFSYTEVPNIEIDQALFNSILAEYGSNPTAYTFNGHPGAYVLTEVTESGMTAKVLISAISYDGYILVFLGMDLTRLMSEQDMLSLTTDLLQTVSVTASSAPAQQSETADGYQLGKFNMRFSDTLDIEVADGVITAMNMETITVVVAMTINFPFAVDTASTSHESIAENFFTGMGDTSNESYSDTTVQGCPAIKFECDLAQNGMTMKVYGYIILSGNDALCVAGMSLPGMMDPVYAAVEYTVSSLVVNR